VEIAVAVLVVGAGPVGLALACGLAGQGAEVRVVDRADGPAVTSRANILHARGVEVLDRLGALGDLPASALAPVGMAMHARGEHLATMRFAPSGERPTNREKPRSGEGTTNALFVSQASVEGELRRRLSDLGVQVEWGVRVSALEQDGDGVDVGLDGAWPTRADWVAGCDGAHSTVRDLAGIPFPGVAVVEQFLLADVHASWERERTVSVGWFHKDGMLLAIPMPEPGTGSRESGTLWRLMADVPPTDHRLTPADIVARFEQLLPERAEEHGVRIEDTVWTSVFRIHRRLADDYRAGRILLAGDAAHIHSPIGGQGMNTGVGDAENLAWKLALVAAGAAGPGLLDTYTAERRPLATEVLRRTTANTRILAAEGPIMRLVRDRVFVPLLNLPAVQRTATETASQLGVGYRKGPLGGGRGAGERVADRPCRHLDGRLTRLYAELGTHWALLLPSPSEQRVAEVRRCLGERVVPLTADGLDRPELVRPDGHRLDIAALPKVLAV
jgi:2-polyprenyl-6-methoxyphenol hydroxylase-like FAD-dependent oxidoreductase